jgi:3-methyladenine DNA glycosylase AlkD
VPTARYPAPTAGARVESLVAALAAAGTPERALAERAYLKSELTHWGASVPSVRRIVRTHLREHPVDHDGALALAEALWADPVHERRLAAVELLVVAAGRRPVLGPNDLGAVRSFVERCATWALVDPLASEVAGAILARHPERLAVLDEWSRADVMWVRRSSVLALRRTLREDRELPRFLRLADELLDEREFFIRKAIGWVAREVGARHPDELRGWLLERLDRLGAVTLREAIKPLPDGDAVLAAWRAQRGQVTRR